MEEVVAQAFLSYAHTDDEHEGGRVLRLAKLIQNEFETLTGTTIAIFTDKAEIKWGQDFRNKLNEALQETTFFIPVLTPTYFLRDECRKEMSQFVSSAKELGLEELLLSIRYVAVPDMQEGSTDELKDVAASMQYESWDDLRLEDENSSKYRTAINRLALRLVELTRDLEAKPVQAAPRATKPRGDAEEAKRASQSTEVGEMGPGDDDTPGPLDLVADLQPAMTEWTETISALTPATEAFNLVVNESAERMNASNGAPNAFAAKVLVARQLAETAEKPLSEIEALSKEYSTGLLRLDPGIRALLGMVAGSDEDTKEIGTFLNSVQEMVNSALESASSLRQAADAAREVARLSRDIRPVFRRYETAVRNVADGSAIIEAWQPLLDEVRSKHGL